MECNIIILSEEQMIEQLNISLDEVSMKVNYYIATTFHDGIYQALRYPYDLIILTVLQSMEFTYQAVVLTRRLKNTPILVLIPESEEWREHLIKAGADQVLWETTRNRELELGIYALVRRYQWNAQEKTDHKIIQEGVLLMDYITHSATWNGVELPLVKREFDFLFLLAATPERVYSCSEIYQIIHGEEEPANVENLFYCMVYRIRKKLAKVDPRLPGMIKRKKDVGYCFQRISDI